MNDAESFVLEGRGELDEDIDVKNTPSYPSNLERRMSHFHMMWSVAMMEQKLDTTSEQQNIISLFVDVKRVKIDVSNSKKTTLYLNHTSKIDT
jgi:hypothetical protein